MKNIPLAAFLSCAGYQLTEDEKRLFSLFKPAGITLFSRNIKDEIQLKNLIDEIKNITGDDVLIAVDQEGGRVRRLKEPVYRKYASQWQIGSLDNKKAAKAAKLHAELISQDLRNVGIDINFAPVLDVWHKSTTNSLETRCFSDDALKVAKLGKIMLENYIESAIIPCIKHLPGHGLAEVDPHLGLPVIKAGLDQLANEFYPFKQCSNSPMGMTAHIVLEAIDDKFPITLSKKGINDIIRGEIGFDGFLISDAIDMHALCGTPSQKALAALDAGCDCVCYCFGNIEEMTELCNNCPRMADNSLVRLDKAKQILHNRYERLSADDAKIYAELTGETVEYAVNYDATEVLNNMQRKRRKCLHG